jgi:PLP dependent protein
MSIAENIELICRQLPPHVRPIVVTKQVSSDRMRLAYQTGMRDFGESKIQEIETKQQELADLPDICWHLIGHLQGNKVRKAVAMCNWIHSVDSLKLARQIDRVAAELDRRPQVCLQVKMLPDPDKYGWEVSALRAEILELKALAHLDIRGLMAIPPLGVSDPEIEDLFDRAHQLAIDLDLSELSMGMSGDYQIAVKHGSTMVRIGSVIFGNRINV